MGVLTEQLKQRLSSSQSQLPQGKLTEMLRAKLYSDPNYIAERFIAQKMAIEEQQRKAEEEKRKLEEQLRRQQEAISQFQARQEAIRRQAEEGGLWGKVKSFYAGVKDWLGRGETLPEIEGGSPVYQAQRQAQLAEQEYRRNLAGRFALGAEKLAAGLKEYIGKKKEAFEKSKEERGIVGTQIEEIKGVAKNLGELASGAGKAALEFSPLTGMSGIRKLVKFVGGKPVEEYLDRNSPEYLKRVDAFLDENGILNYKAKYLNEIQKTGGEVAEIGSWFIPITRAGKVEKIEKAIAEIPQVAKVLGTAPKVVKVGGKLMYEVSKDVIDVAVLNQLRGKTWEETKSDLKAVAAGGAVLRGTGMIAKGLANLRKSRLINQVEKAIPDLDDAERKLASDLIAEGKPIDDIATDIFARREQAGKNIFRGFKEIENRAEKSKNLLPEEKIKKTGNIAIKEIPISKLKSIEGDRELAMADFEAGRKSKTKLPILVKPEADGTYTILDGNGRVIEAEKAGKKTIQAITDENLYRKLTEEKIKVPFSQLPVGEGKEKVSRLAQRMYQKLEGLPDYLKQTPVYRQMNKPKQLAKDAELVVKSQKEAMDILRGAKPIPEGHTYAGIWRALWEEAKGNPKLATDLASLRFTRYGQEFSLLTDIDIHSPVRYLKAMREAKIEILGGEEKLQRAISKKVKEGVKEIKRLSAKTNWEAFIKSIEC